MTRFKLHRRVMLCALSVSLLAACQPTPGATIQTSNAQAPTAGPTPAPVALGLSGSADIGGIPFANAEVKVFQPGQATPIATGRTGPDGQFSLTIGNVISAGGGNVISAGGGNVISAGGGNVISAGGGNVISAGGGNVISAGGGNLIGAGAPLKVVASKDGATLAAIGVAGVISAGGGNVISAGGGNVISAGGGNVISAGGMNYRTLQAPRRVQMNAATTLAVVALGNRLEGALKAAVRKDGLAIDSVVAEVLKAFDQLTGSVNKTLGAGGSDSLVASVTKALDPNGQGQLEATAQQQLNQLAPDFRAAFVAAATELGAAITQAVQSGGSSPDSTAQAPITFAGVEVKGVTLPTNGSGDSTSTTTTPTTSSGGSGGGGTTATTPTGVTLGGNLNNATPTTAGTWTSPFGDLSSFALLGNVASTARFGQASVVIGNDVYLFGGTTDGTNATATDATLRVPLIGSGALYADTPVPHSHAKLTATRFGATAIRLGGKVYVLGGEASAPTNAIDSILETDLAGTGVNFAATGVWLVESRSRHAIAMAGTETNGRLYVTGGNGISTVKSSVEVSVVTSGVPGAPAYAAHSLVTPRYGHAAVVTHTAGNVPAYLYVFGGRDATGSLDSVEVAPLAANGDLAGPFTIASGLQLYDAVKGESRSRHGLRAAIVQGKLFLFGGVNLAGGVYKTVDGADVMTIDPTTGQLGAPTAHHNAFVWGRGYYSLAVHSSGNVFAFGGTPEMPGSGPNPNIERAFWR